MLKYGFAGTSNFAAEILAAILAGGYGLSSVITRPDQPAGRGQQLQETAVARLAAAHKLRVHKPVKIDAEFCQLYQTEKPDLVIVVDYGQLLPQRFLDLPPQGCVNIHSSLLPRWRGAAPIARAIEAGDQLSGISLIRISEKLDAGAILMQRECPIAATDTAAALTTKLIKLARQVTTEFLANPGPYDEIPQDESQVTYAAKLTKAEAQIDWQEAALSIARKINAFNPRPGAYSWLGTTRVKLLQARVATAASLAPSPGKIKHTKQALLVECGSGAIQLLQLQFAGGSPLSSQQIQGSSPLATHKNFSCRLA